MSTEGSIPPAGRTDDQRNARTVAAYEDYADTYAQIVGDVSFEGSVDAMRQLVAVCPPGGSVLEVGSGTGHDADFLEAQGLLVRRTDATESFLRLQRARGKQAELLNVLTDALGGPYDAIQALCVLIHVEQGRLDDVLASMRAALREDGHLLLSMRIGQGSDESGDWFTALWTVEALVERLAAQGFEVVWRTEHDGRGTDRWAIFLTRRR